MATGMTDPIAELATLSTAELRARWERAGGRPAPKRASRDLLLRLVAYHLQEQTEGGLSKGTRRRLAKLGGLNGQDSQTPTPATSRLKPGCRLIREWHGVTHSVIVLDHGFDYRGTRYAMPIAPWACPSMKSLISFVLKAPQPPPAGNV